MNAQLFFKLAALGLLAIVPVLFFRKLSRLGRFQATEAA